MSMRPERDNRREKTYCTYGYPQYERCYKYGQQTDYDA